MNGLSDRQKKILEYIIKVDNDIPPTIREIGEAVNISSTSVVNYNLNKLEELELVTRKKEVSRGLRPNWDKLRELGMADTFDVDHQNGGNGSANGNGVTSKLSDAGAVVLSAVDNFLSVPVLGHIAAGEPIEVDAEGTKAGGEMIELPLSKFGRYEDLFALRVQGDSMIDASVLNGDIVVLHRQDTADDGDMVAAWVVGDEETTLKHFYQDGRNVRLEPANPNYKTIVRDADKVRINGKVVAVQRDLP